MRPGWGRTQLEPDDYAKLSEAPSAPPAGNSPI
jgi:hypothetical protein